VWKKLKEENAGWKKDKWKRERLEAQKEGHKMKANGDYNKQ